ncbi:hypothetical protein CAEBREN_12676 [Caenorhabditis brenneri]|uniref:Tyrosine-protein phosphatase domain-containing protein n=1 Tax=Caenorhabditis brenneri TaxID=135651 RepID=G0N1K2_CAEBE|nr:hypothetical protein CAEBREN_12676 [Caenorhabditis brenneri]
MGAKSSKDEKGHQSEHEALAPSASLEDLESGLNHRDPENQKLLGAESVRSKETIIDIPKTGGTEEEEEELRTETRLTTGSETDVSDYPEEFIDNDVDIIQPFQSESAFNDTAFSEISKVSSDSLGKFEVLDYLKSRGIDVSHPKMLELIESTDYQEFIQLRKTMLTPRELFERDNGPVHGGDTLKYFKKGEEVEEMMQTIPPLFSEVVASSLPKSSDSLTDLSDDEDGWPKYDMNEFMEKASKGVTYQNPLIPTMEDYLRDKGTCGQEVYNSYEFVAVTNHLDGKTHWECHGPDGTRTQDFWTQCHDDRISLISMFGKFDEKRGVNCARYIPEDDWEELTCGKVIVRRLTDPEYPFEHCKIQKFAARCTLVPEENGWYPVWHCTRALQEDPTKDYTRENKEFNELRMKLLEEMPSTQWLQHGPMVSSALFDPMIERNSYLIDKEGSKVPEFINQPIEAARMRQSFYCKRALPEDVFDHLSISTDSATSVLN